MRILRSLYKETLKHIFLKINKPFTLIKDYSNFCSEKIILIGKKKYKIYELNEGKIFMDSSESKYFYIYKNFILPHLSIDISGIKSSSNIFKYGINKFCKSFNFEIISIVSGRDAKDNYYHWLIDVLPRIIILEKELNKFTNLNLLVPDFNNSYQKESLDCFFKKKKTNFISLNKNKFSKFKKITLCSNNENYEYFNFYLLSKLKKRVLIKANEKKIFFNNEFQKIYISRSDSRNERSFKQNHEIEEFLVKKGFKIVVLSEFSFLEKAMIFNKAKVILGLHGAGLANILFSKKKTKIIEITSPKWPDMFEKLSKCLMLNYKKVIIKKIDKNNTVNLSISEIKKFI